MNTRHAALNAVVGRAMHPNSSARVEGILLAFECLIACELRTARDRSTWMFGQEIWDQVYPEDVTATLLAYAKSGQAEFRAMREQVMREFSGQFGPRPFRNL